MANNSSSESPWPVRVVAARIAEWVSRLGEVWVEGQITQLTRRPGSRIAFGVLRDSAADISLSVTAPSALLADPALRDGARVVVRARPDFYVARGTLSLRATEIRQVGIGELLARLEHLKRLLHSEGLFDPARKRPPPFLPGLVGLITGRDSAAQRDVLENARRRWPAVRFRVENVPVQGVGAVPEVVGALSRLDADPEVEVIVLARGGGSVQDLLPFSDETLCRAVAACRTPVLSAIGHEPDSPLLDLVADVRCSTPTDAGKTVVPDITEERNRVATMRLRGYQAVAGRLERDRQWLAAVRGRPVLLDPDRMITGRAEDVDRLRERARRCLAHRLDAAGDQVAQLRARVASLSPAATLERGYAVVLRPDGRVVRAPADVAGGDRLGIRVAGGSFSATADQADTGVT